MLFEAFVKGKRYRLDPTKAKGKGGEGDIFDLGILDGKHQVLKLFKQSNHPDIDGDAHEQKVAKNRILEHQKKLPKYPKGLPKNVITPIELAKDKTGKIVGYTMRFLAKAEVLYSFSERKFRDNNPYTQDDVVNLLIELAEIVEKLHPEIVIGDFNDLGVMIEDNQVHLIDSDSFQFGDFKCKAFSSQFVDPLLCDPDEKKPMLCKPHNTDSDWYAFSNMVMRCLLFVDVHGGIYRPKDSSKRVKHDTRPLKGVTVFDPEVKYPKKGIHFSMLPDEMLQFFHKIFVKRERFPFPVKLLREMRWTKCSICSTEHAREKCPECSQLSPAAIKQTEVYKGTVSMIEVFSTKGTILTADFQNGKMVYLYHESGGYRREDEELVFPGNLESGFRYRVSGNRTLVGKDNGKLLVVEKGKTKTEMLSVDCVGRLPIFDTNSTSVIYPVSGSLKKTDFSSEFSDFVIELGDVLPNQTMLWCGENFGFGFYRAGGLSVYFVFDTNTRALNDNVKIPKISGRLIDSVCTFSSNLCWFFVTVMEGSQRVNRCYLINEKGEVVGIAESSEGDDSWLSSIRGNCAFGKFLLSSTDEGIVRIENNHGSLVVGKEFPDTEPFVSNNSILFPGKTGIHVVERDKILLISIS